MMKSAKGTFAKENGDWKLTGFEVYRIGTREVERIPRLQLTTWGKLPLARPALRPSSRHACDSSHGDSPFTFREPVT